jgi:hypothetical protein
MQYPKEISYRHGAPRTRFLTGGVPTRLLAQFVGRAPEVWRRFGSEGGIESAT